MFRSYKRCAIQLRSGTPLTYGRRTHWRPRKTCRTFSDTNQSWRLHELQVNQIRKKSSQIQMVCNSATTVARRCTPFSYGRAPRGQTNLASPLPSSRHCPRERTSEQAGSLRQASQVPTCPYRFLWSARGSLRTSIPAQRHGSWTRCPE